MNAETFNRLYPVGTLVFAYPGARPEDIPSARRLVTRTRTKAQVSASGDPVVWVEGEGAYIALTHVDPVAKDAWEKAKTDEAVAGQGALPMPVGTQEREAEAAARRRITDLLWWSVPSGDNAEAKAIAQGMLDVFTDAVRATQNAELAKLRADQEANDREFEKVTADLDEARQQLADARTATLTEVIDLIERFAAGALERAAFRDLVTELRRISAVAAPQEGDSDRRRRIYIDGHGEAWISLSHDSNIRYIGRLAGAFHGDETTDTVREHTGSLREIGRCW
ncbi:hypothetical protein [Streptomyces ziwulingensis]|uniref:Uncharacterized protein n=1 Tax=Streptomyces ziwulingensis TaxID=1045501 RepID=A0ABP9CZW2_9ACTN